MAEEALGEAGAPMPGAVSEEHLHDRIKMVAYELWQQEGMPEGRAMHHWDEATRRVLAEMRGDRAPPLAGSEAAPANRVQPDPRKEQPGLSADTGGTPGAPAFDDIGRA